MWRKKENLQNNINNKSCDVHPPFPKEKWGHVKPNAAAYDGRMTNLNWRTTATNHLDFLDLKSEAAALAAALAPDLASVVGLKTLLGLIAFLILNAAHAVPRAWPAALSPSLVASAACSPYLQSTNYQIHSSDLVSTMTLHPPCIKLCLNFRIISTAKPESMDF